MNIYLEHEQRSPEWFAARKGLFTASKVGTFCAEPFAISLTVAEIKALLDAAGAAYKSTMKRDELLAILPNAESFMALVPAAQTLIDATLGEAADGEDRPPDLGNYWTRRGTEMEPEAVAAYESKTGHKVTGVGLCIHDSGHFGASPDGLIYEDFTRLCGNVLVTDTTLSHGLEIKCPEGKTHLKYLRAGTVPDEYLCQVHCQLAVTGCAFWDFFSYHPNLPPLLVRIERDEFTERLCAGLIALGEEKRRQEKALAEAWRAEFEGNEQ